jgi:hypothetical protein
MVLTDTPGGGLTVTVGLPTATVVSAGEVAGTQLR